MTEESLKDTETPKMKQRLIYSTYALFAMTAALTEGNQEAVMSYMHEFYFESAATKASIVLFIVGYAAVPPTDQFFLCLPGEFCGSKSLLPLRRPEKQVSARKSAVFAVGCSALDVEAEPSKR